MSSVSHGVLLALGLGNKQTNGLGVPSNDGEADEKRRHDLVRYGRPRNMLTSSQLSYGANR